MAADLGAIETRRGYLWAFLVLFGRECYRTWRQEVFASFIGAVIAYFLQRARQEPAAWSDFRLALEVSGIILGGFAAWHLFRTPWLLHKETSQGNRPSGICAGTFGALVILAMGAFLVLGTVFVVERLDRPQSAANNSQPPHDVAPSNPAPLESGKAVPPTPKTHSKARKIAPEVQAPQPASAPSGTDVVARTEVLNVTNDLARTVQFWDRDYGHITNAVARQQLTPDQVVENLDSLNNEEEQKWKEEFAPQIEKAHNDAIKRMNLPDPEHASWSADRQIADQKEYSEAIEKAQTFAHFSTIKTGKLDQSRQDQYKELLTYLSKLLTQLMDYGDYPPTQP